MVSRFFVTETVSGIDRLGGYADKQKTKPHFMRVAQSIRLIVELNPEQQETIRIPYLIINYVEKDVNLLKSDETLQVTYFMDYFEEFSKTWNAIRGVMIGV
jgi:hypothetical protein